MIHTCNFFTKFIKLYIKSCMLHVTLNKFVDKLDYRFCARNTSMFILVGFSYERLDVTVSSVIPVLFNLANKILKENQDDSTLIRNLKRYIIDYMEKKYADIKTREILNIATFLDTRFKTDFVEGVELQTFDETL